MVCSDCGLFQGTPVCGACRALRRICALLRSGHLGINQEKRVTEVLRGAAGELTDLVEENLPKGDRVDSITPKEGTKSPTSGLSPPRQAAGEKGEESGYSEESSEEEDVEEEVDTEVKPTKEGDTEGKTPVRARETEDRAPDSPEVKKEGGTEGSSSLTVLTRDLELHPVSKSSARGPKKRNLRRSPAGGSAKTRRDDRPRTPEGRPRGARPGDDEGSSPSRQPLPRRKRKADRPKSRGSRGLKKRQRAQEFRQRKIDERRREKQEKEWHRKQKQEGGQRQWQQ